MLFRGLGVLNEGDDEPDKRCQGEQGIKHEHGLIDCGGIACDVAVPDEVNFVYDIGRGAADYHPCEGEHQLGAEAAFLSVKNEEYHCGGGAENDSANI